MMVRDFSEGDRVQHPDGSIGTVVSIERTRFGDPGVIVEFDAKADRKEWRGHYDDLWLSEHHLRKVDQS